MAQQFTPEDAEEAARLLVECGVPIEDATQVALEALRLAESEVP